MDILYIEDDTIDIKNCQLIVAKHSECTVTIARSFEEAISILNQENISFIISDRRIGMDNYSEFWENFFGIPCFVLSNQLDESLFDLTIPPLGAYEKPIRLEQVKEMLEMVSSKEQTPNMEYAENITAGEPELLREMADILKSQFLDAIDKIPYLYENEDIEQLIQVIHKLIGKFSVLSMKDSFSFFNLTEKYLREGLTLKEYAYKRLLADLKTGVDFIKEYIEINELHNS